MSKILDENKLIVPNYVDWKRNLIIVLIVAKVTYVLTTDLLSMIPQKQIKMLMISGMMQMSWLNAIYCLYDQCVVKATSKPSYCKDFDLQFVENV